MMLFKLIVILICFFILSAMQIKVTQADMPKWLPKQKVPSGSTVEMKAADSEGRYIDWCLFGIAKPEVFSPDPIFLEVGKDSSEPSGAFVLGYDSRVSFIGNVPQGKAWFRIANVNVNDSKTYKILCLVGGKDYVDSKMELEVLPASATTTQAPVTEAPPTPEWEALGCYEDSRDRALPIYYYRVAYDPTKEDYKGMFEECKKRAEEKGYEYFGIQHKSECWGSPNGQEITYNKHGCLNNCLRTADGYGIGTHWSNFIYRLNKEWSDCKDGVQYKLVSKKDTCYECPSYNIKIEKSDTSREC